MAVVGCVALAAVAGPATAGLLVNQPPIPADWFWYDDSACSVTGGAQSVAVDMVLTEQTAVVQATLWAYYFGIEPATDDFVVIVHEDAGGVPGAVANGGAAIRTNIAITRSPGPNFGFERELRLRFAAIVLDPGTYWVEIYNNTPPTSCFGWELSAPDPLRSPAKGVRSLTTPGTGPWIVLGDVFGDDGDAAVIIEGGDPLDVELTSFHAMLTAEGVLLSWRTESESDTAGFRLLRAAVPQGRGKAVEVALHPGVLSPKGGETSGAQYRFQDNAKLDPGTYQYFLEDIDLFGTVTRHGPVVVDTRTTREAVGSVRRAVPKAGLPPAGAPANED